MNTKHPSVPLRTISSLTYYSFLSISHVGIEGKPETCRKNRCHHWACKDSSVLRRIFFVSTQLLLTGAISLVRNHRSHKKAVDICATWLFIPVIYWPAGGSKLAVILDSASTAVHCIQFFHRGYIFGFLHAKVDNTCNDQLSRRRQRILAGQSFS